MNSNVNREHKNSVFSLLFSTPEILRELYSAIEGISLPKDVPININTLSEVLFRKQINDISFTIDDRLVVLIEHQSTLSENLPLRFLEYTGRVYEKIIDPKKRYQTKLVKIPKPDFIVLYNGKNPCPDYREMKLSDAFKDSIDLEAAKKLDIPLELTAKIYNINPGHNEDILKKSDVLGGYSTFVGKVWECEKRQLTLEESVRIAIKYCIENNVLKDFLKRNSSEVINMLFAEYNFEEEAEVIREEAFEDGIELGIEKGREEGFKLGSVKTRELFLSLLDQGLSADEIKQRLQF